MVKQGVALAAVAALFLVGVLVGVFGTHLYYAQLLRRPAGPSHLANREFGGRLERLLDLNAEQRREIDRIVRDSRLRSEELRREMVPRVQEMMAETRQEIEAVLTDEQKEVFEAMRQRYRGRVEHFLLGPPPDAERRPHRLGRPHHPERPPLQ